MRITWSEPAVANLEAIYHYISGESPGRAGPFIQRLIEAAESLQELPRRGRVVPEGDGSQREIFVDSYRLIYRIDNDQIFIVTVVHGARDVAALWKDRGGRKPAR